MSQVHQLTEAERNELSQYEETIERNLMEFFEVGRALLAIREKRLYRQSHHSFDAYCRTRWGMSKTNANRLIQSAVAVENVAPIGVKPANEAQVRPLTRLEPEQQKQVWRKAVETAPRGAVTARHVQRVVKEIAGATRPVQVRDAPEPNREDDGLVVGEFGEAFKAMMRAILSAKKSGWRETSKERVLECLDNLREVALERGNAPERS